MDRYEYYMQAITEVLMAFWF